MILSRRSVVSFVFRGSTRSKWMETRTASLALVGTSKAVLKDAEYWIKRFEHLNDRLQNAQTAFDIVLVRSAFSIQTHLFNPFLFNIQEEQTMVKEAEEKAVKHYRERSEDVRPLKYGDFSDNPWFLLGAEKQQCEHLRQKILRVSGRMNGRGIMEFALAKFMRDESIARLFGKYEDPESWAVHSQLKYVYGNYILFSYAVPSSYGA